MDNNSIDKKIKSHFENRSIDPTSEAWDRLDAMLTINENPKRSFGWKYIAVAASIAFLVMAINIVTTKDIQKPENEIAVTGNVTDVKEIVNLNESQVEQTPSESKHLTSTNVDEKVTPKFNHVIAGSFNKVNKAAQGDKTQLIASGEKNEVAVLGLGLKGNEVSPDKDLSLIPETEVFLKTSEVAIVEDKKSRIDPKKLLESVENSFSESNKLDISHRSNKKRIDPGSILAEVESEVDKSFLSKVFKEIQATSNTVITSVSNRNMAK